MMEDGTIIRLWDDSGEVRPTEDEQTPWKVLKVLKDVVVCVVAVLVFGLATCSKASFLLLITLANEGTKTILSDHKPVALLCIGCSLVASSVLLLLKSVWKACHKTSKLPKCSTAALVLFFEFVVSGGAAVLTIAAMPHLDIVSNVAILNSVAVISSLFQVIAQCSANARNRFLVPSIFAFLLILLGYVLFLTLYITKNPADTRTVVWVGLAVGGSFFVSFNWWEGYFQLISKSSGSVFFKNLCQDLTTCQNVLHILSSVLRILVTACVLGAYVPLSKMDWFVLKSISRFETKVIVITVGVQLISSALCHWFGLAACKMHALRRCFILPLYLASLAVLALFVIPVVVYYEQYIKGPNTTTVIDFGGYCDAVVNNRNQSVTGSVFPQLVLDVTQTLCFLGITKVSDIGILTGSSASLWLGLVLATIHLWQLNVSRIQRTQDLFIRRLYEGAFIEQSLLLNTRFDIQTTGRKKRNRPIETVMVYLCATMWHETYDEMMKIIISMFRLDKYRPKADPKFNDFTFEAHIYFDDAFEHIGRSEDVQLNKYAKNLVEIITAVYRTFTNMNGTLFRRNEPIPDQKILMTPYGGRLIITMPYGNNIVIHFKNKDLIRHKKRWSQVMYLYYLLGFKLMTKFYERWQKGETEVDIRPHIKKDKQNTYILALDGDTDFQPSSVMLLIDRLRMYPRVGAACGRIHPTGSGPTVWFQKFEYAVSHWLQKTAEHVLGCVLCSPGCFSLFRAAALMDDNVMKTYATKSTEASHFIQYDQGEDRWLCTLLLKRGWRVEYNAASDAYTNAPEDFKELFNQRRRWGPSTLGNIVDLLGDTNSISRRNTSVSKLYMLYQLFNILSSILSPATICLLIAGSLNFIFSLNSIGALVLAVIPPAIYLGLCFKLQANTQILIAGILSVMYAFLMLVVTLSIIGSMVEQQTILTPASMFVIVIAVIYVVTALLHPQEFRLLFYGVLYIVCIPSAYLILIIYSMVNMNNVSWGTRETNPTAGAERPAAKAQLTTAEKAKNTLQKFVSCMRCKTCNQREDTTMILEPGQHELEPQNTIVEDVRVPDEEETPNNDVSSSQRWVKELQDLFKNHMCLKKDTLEKAEQAFFKDLQEKYLKPLDNDKEKQTQMLSDLRDLRNKVTFVFFMINALWLVATLTLQIKSDIFSIRIPKISTNLSYTGEEVLVEPISFMFLLGFAASILVQFLAMIHHRVYTLIHFVAFLDTEPTEPVTGGHLPENKVET
ncbi:chitin synthase chs-2-like [Betta splendens]|uniref:chitin synthase n=1 Tax=Betta splendens TaxID=158456 RepID=A0A6P7NU22_BETSP|nr:chitin synthase chs-2-like [Betta splendens]